MKNIRWPLNLTPHGKLKQKILGIAVAVLLPSLLLIDIINVRTGGNHLSITLLINNIHLIAPWGLAYLIVYRYRDLIKIFAPLYLSLALLVTTCSLAFDHHTVTQNLEEKFCKEMMNILKDRVDFLNITAPSSQNQSRAYSADQYGFYAIYLNKFKKWMDLYKQENRDLVLAFNEVELDKVFTEEVLFNFFNIVDKKNKLERLSLFLDESAKRTEDIHSEYAEWVLSSPEIDEVSRKNLANAISTSPEEKKFFRQESYRIKKNIVLEFVAFLDFLSKAYGDYWIGEDGRILFSKDKDLQAFRSHCEMIEKLGIEEENFLLLSQEKIVEIEKSV